MTKMPSPTVTISCIEKNGIIFYSHYNPFKEIMWINACVHVLGKKSIERH